MLKKLVLIGGFAMLFAYADAQKGQEVQNIQNVIVRFFDGISGLDDQKIRAETAENFSLLENGAVWNIDSLLNVLKPLKAHPYTRVNKFNFLRTRGRNGTAWISYENLAEMNINGKSRKVKWLESAVLIKQNGKWKIELLHSTVLK